MSHFKNINIFLPMISDTVIFILYSISISQISSKSFLKPMALVISYGLIFFCIGKLKISSFDYYAILE